MAEGIVEFTEDADGAYHSENDKPSVIWSDDREEWHWHGLRHRENDMPAVISTDYDILGEAIYRKEWWRFGRIYRVAGPALVIIHKGIEYRDWFIQGRRVDYESYKNWMLAIHLTEYVDEQEEEKLYKQGLKR